MFLLASYGDDFEQYTIINIKSVNENGDLMRGLSVPVG